MQLFHFTFVFTMGDVSPSFRTLWHVLQTNSWLTGRALLQDLGAMGYKFQFVTLAGFHSLNHGMFELSQGYSKRGMAAYSELQQVRFLL